MSDQPNFDAAEEFIRQARAADESGDLNLRLAACKMVSIALGLDGLAPNGKMHTAHLVSDDHTDAKSKRKDHGGTVAGK